MRFQVHNVAVLNGYDGGVEGSSYPSFHRLNPHAAGLVQKPQEDGNQNGFRLQPSPRLQEMPKSDGPFLSQFSTFRCDCRYLLRLSLVSVVGRLVLHWRLAVNYRRGKIPKALTTAQTSVSLQENNVEPDALSSSQRLFAKSTPLAGGAVLRSFQQTAGTARSDARVASLLSARRITKTGFGAFKIALLRSS
jgi:hypothetical protein